MHIFFENLQYELNSSCKLKIRNLESIPFKWHFHPQYELTLTLNSHGQRYVNDSITDYSNFDLTLLGPNIPHTWHSYNRYDHNKPHKVYVLWFNQSWIEQVIINYY